MGPTIGSRLLFNILFAVKLIPLMFAKKHSKRPINAVGTNRPCQSPKLGICQRLLKSKL